MSEPGKDSHQLRAEELFVEWFGECSRNDETATSEIYAQEIAAVAAHFRLIAAREYLDGRAARAQEIISKDAEIASLRAETERLNEKFSCGHRKADWDNSYDDCMACKLKEQADSYDNLPHEVIECHDKIEELQAELREWETIIGTNADPLWVTAQAIKKERDTSKSENEKLKANFVSQSQQAEAWQDVVHELEKLQPGFLLAPFTGLECAVQAIRNLRRLKPSE
jgi:DNA repair exonuclease SbcCD ATPase subunit